MSAMIADFLDELDKAGYGDKCQTERCTRSVKYQIVVCWVCVPCAKTFGV